MCNSINTPRQMNRNHFADTGEAKSVSVSFSSTHSSLNIYGRQNNAQIRYSNQQITRKFADHITTGSVKYDMHVQGQQRMSKHNRIENQTVLEAGTDSINIHFTDIDIMRKYKKKICSDAKIYE